MSAFFGAWGAVFVAELGDKTQMVVLACASRYRWQAVVAAFLLSTALLTLLGAVAGGLIAAALPVRLVKVAAACAFLGFAFWTARKGEDKSADERCPTGSFWAVASLFLLAEMGDKTQLVTLTLAANASSGAAGLHETARALTPVWCGAFVGMAAADLVGLAIGLVLHRRLPVAALRWVAAVLFALFGLFTLHEALSGLPGLSSGLRLAALGVASGTMVLALAVVRRQTRKRASLR